MNRTTQFSPCRRYRYTLWREWSTFEMFDGCNDGERGSDRAREYLMIIGLNPSTADETKDDPTIRRCIGFAKAWGFGGLCMTNLFAFRATDPKVMKAAVNPVGDENDQWLFQMADCAGLILAAWGAHGSFLDRDKAIIRAIPKLHCLRTNADGSPQHPLYVPAATIPVRYPTP